jgi:hypothetical protein
LAPIVQKRQRGEPNRQAGAPLATMDRFYLVLACAGIVVLVTALALSAPKEPRGGQPDATVLLNSGRR